MPTREYVLFVCDSLMKGEDQHTLLNTARPLGEAATPAAYDLVDLGSTGALVAGGITAVSGELYALEPAALAAIDIDRGHPILHQRTTIRLADGRDAEAYLMASNQVAGRRRIRTGDWRKRPGAPGVGAAATREAPSLVRWARRRFDPPR
jgi:gamma-glutamylcyclotransferase (GGCT)/AIG2-like uncharacterized protein YtfP